MNTPSSMEPGVQWESTAALDVCSPKSKLLGFYFFTSKSGPYFCTLIYTNDANSALWQQSTIQSVTQNDGIITRQFQMIKKKNNVISSCWSFSKDLWTNGINRNKVLLALHWERGCVINRFWIEIGFCFSRDDVKKRENRKINFPLSCLWVGASRLP